LEEADDAVHLVLVILETKENRMMGKTVVD
jgi:hypothetical protein